LLSMKSVLTVSTLCLLLVAAAAGAQTPAPKGTTAAPTQPAPAAPAPAQPAPAAAKAAPRPFPADAKIAYIDLNTVATSSREGQAAGVKIKDLQTKRTAELEGKQKQLQAAQQKLEQGGAVLSESARAQQAKEVERLQTELQRSSQDAQKEVQEFTQELQVQFQQKLLPIIEQVAKAKNLHFILSIADAGVVWVDAGLNVTADVVTALDAATPAK
jgi:Skp family chaperone for outer membrane proteins